MEDFMYAALGVDRHHLLANSALPDAPVVPERPHRLSTAARRLVARRIGRSAARHAAHRPARPAAQL